MRKRKGLVFVLGIALIALAIGAILAAPVLADPAGKVKGVVTGLLPIPDQDGSLALWESLYTWNIHQVEDSGAAKGYSTFRIWGTRSEFLAVKFEFDCVRFLVTEDGRSAAISSGKVVKAQQPDWIREMYGEWEGRLAIGMVIDGGPGGEDEVYYWYPKDAVFYPDEGTRLGCVVPEGSVMLPFFVTGGDVEVRMP
jgi:hypothetical protein